MRRTILRSLGALALAFVSSTSIVARADEPSPNAMEKSAALYKHARLLHTHRKWAEAEAAYQSAWDLRRTFDIAGNLGECELRIGQPREAAEHLAYALRNVPAGVLSEQTEALKGMLKEAQAQVGTLRVAVNVRGAQIFVDGRRVDDAAGELFVEPGSRTIEARLAGYPPVSSIVTARAGATERVELELVAEKRSLVPVVVMSSVGGAALVSGIVVLAVGVAKHATSVETSQAISKAHHRCVAGAPDYDSRCAALESGARTTDTLGRVGPALLAGAGAAGVGTLLYLLWPQSRSRSSTGYRVTPVIGEGNTGILVTGKF